MTGLAVPEQDRLRACEDTIRTWVNAGPEVWKALLEIRDSRLYRVQYATFEAYCLDKWGIGKRRAYQMIDAAEAVCTMVHTGAPAPANERQARALAPLAKVDPEAAAEVMRGLGDKPTAAAITEKVTEHLSPTGDTPPPAVPDEATISSLEDLADAIEEAVTADSTEPRGVDLRHAHENARGRIVAALVIIQHADEVLANGRPEDIDRWDALAESMSLWAARWTAQRTSLRVVGGGRRG